MKTSKGFKLFGCVAACAILGGLAIGLAPKAVELTSRAGGDATKTLTITAAQMQAAADVNGNGTLENIGGVNWSFEKVAFETIGGNLTAKIRQGGFLKNTTASGATVSDNMRGTGFVGAKFYNKVANAGSNFRFYEATNLIDPGLGNQGISANSAAVQDYDFPTWTGKENSIVKIGEIGPGPEVEKVATEGYVGFSSIDFRYGCGTADPTLILDSPAAKCDPTETIQLTWTFKNVGGSSPTITFVSSDPSIATVSENGGLVTGVAPGDVTITASFTYNEVLYAASNSINITINDPEAAINYLDWDKTEGGPVYIQGAGMLLAVKHQSIGYSETDGAANVTVTVTGKANPSIVNFQRPGFASAAGLYVTFADAAFSGIKKIVIEVPHKTSGVIYTAVLEVENPDVFPTITKLNGVPYNTYMA